MRILFLIILLCLASAIFGVGFVLANEYTSTDYKVMEPVMFTGGFSTNLLKDDICQQVKLLEKARNKRELTEEEEKTIKRLKKNLDSAEKIVDKEIRDIEKIVE